MARVPFIKMHGLGNDFVVLDARDAALPDVPDATVIALADRYRGIGFDQLIRLEPATEDGAEFRMRIFNSGGGEVEACGNAARCVALLHGRDAKVETAGGVIALSASDGGANVDMGEPQFAWNTIPLAYSMDTRAMPVGWDGLEAPDAVNVGNPHVVFFVPDAADIDLARIGATIETDPLFREGVNVNVASITAEGITLRVWERGAGLTQACGTGACATAVAAIRRGLVTSPVQVTLPGGTLTVAWQEGGTITMTGPAQESFRGTFAI